MFDRTRWSAIGAAIAVTVAGGLALPSARATNTDGGGAGVVFVPIVPCRLFDTRPAPDNVGPRTSPLGATDIYTQQVTGTNGNCTIPAAATAVSLNVTTTNATAASYLTLWPAGASRPLASNLNWVPSSPPTPNKVDVKLSADGRVSLYNNAGNVDVLADVVGYYADHNHDDRYYTKAEVDGAVAAVDDRVITARSDTYPTTSLTVVGGTLQFLDGCLQADSLLDALVVPIIVPIGARLTSVDVDLLDSFTAIPWTVTLHRYTVTDTNSVGVPVATASGNGSGVKVIQAATLSPPDEVVDPGESFVIDFTTGFASANAFCGATVNYDLAG